MFSLSPTTYAMETPLAFTTSHAMFAGIPNLEVGRATAALGEDRDGNGIEDVIVCGLYDGTHGFVSIYHSDTDLDYDAAVPLETVFDSHADIATGGRFGSSTSAVGDIDGDGVADIAVGIWFFNSGATDSGALYIITLNPYGAATLDKSVTVFHQGVQGLDARVVEASAVFGWDVAFLEKVNGITHIVVAKKHRMDDGNYHHLFIDESLQVGDQPLVQPSDLGLGTLAATSLFGLGITAADFDNDGVKDVLVGGNTQPYIYIVPGIASVCGDNVVDGTEQCDDNGTVYDDGCLSTCAVE